MAEARKILAADFKVLSSGGSLMYSGQCFQNFTDGIEIGCFEF